MPQYATGMPQGQNATGMPQGQVNAIRVSESTRAPHQSVSRVVYVMRPWPLILSFETQA